MAKLGIHTQIKYAHLPGENHAWISYETEAGIRHFGLYPNNSRWLDNHPEQRRGGWNGSGTAIREGIDDTRTPTTSLYCELTPEQEVGFLKALDEPQKFTLHGHNCTHWAVDTWKEITGQELTAEHPHEDPVSGKSHAIISPVGLDAHLRSLGPQERIAERSNQEDDRKHGREEYKPGSYKIPFIGALLDHMKGDDHDR